MQHDLAIAATTLGAAQCWRETGTMMCSLRGKGDCSKQRVERKSALDWSNDFISCFHVWGKSSSAFDKHIVSHCLNHPRHTLPKHGLIHNVRYLVQGHLHQLHSACQNYIAHTLPSFLSTNVFKWCPANITVPPEVHLPVPSFSSVILASAAAAI